VFETSASTIPKHRDRHSGITFNEHSINLATGV